MKKIKNIMFIAFVVFLLSGCDLNYNLKINEDLSSDEKIIFNVNEKIIDDIEETDGEGSVNEMIGYYKPLIEKEKYKTDYKYNNTLVFNASKSNNYIILNEEIMEERYKFYDISCNPDICMIYAVAKDDILAYDGCVYNLSLNIQVPYKVLENNADKIDKYSNTYTWYSKAGDDNSDIILIFKKEGTNIILINKIF